MLYLLRIASALTIAFAYMLFDIFNKRNVPDVFAYATLAYAFVVGLFAGSFMAVIESILAAVAVLGFGYFVYKIGQLGAADAIELAAISLLIFAPPIPILLTGISQLGVPLIVSLLLNTGLVAVLFVSLYYIPLAVKKLGPKILKQIEQKDILRFVIIAVSYSLFLIFLIYFFDIGTYGTIVILLALAGSSLLILFEKPITYTMIDMVGVDRFDEGDIIAFNLMSQKEISSAKKEIASFDRLVTRALIEEMKHKKIKEKFPVYKRAVPLALPIFAALVVTLLFGNLMLLVLVR